MASKCLLQAAKRASQRGPSAESKARRDDARALIACAPLCRPVQGRAEVGRHGGPVVKVVRLRKKGGKGGREDALEERVLVARAAEAARSAQLKTN